MNPALPQPDIAGSMSPAPSSPSQYIGDKVQTDPLKPSPPPQDSQLHSTASTPRKRPDLDNILNPSPQSTQDLSLPSISVLPSTNEPEHHHHHTLHNTLSLELSPVSQATVFDHSPAHSTISMPDVEQERDHSLFKSYSLKPLGTPAVPSPEPEEQDELNEDEDDLSHMVAGPSNRPPYPMRATVSPTPSVEPQGPLPPQVTASPLDRPTLPLPSRAKGRSKNKNPQGTPQLTTSGADVEMKDEGSSKKFPCAYVSPLPGVPPCDAQIGKGADLTRHMNEIHGVYEARLVANKSLDVSFAKRYLADLASTVKHAEGNRKTEDRADATLVLQAIIVHRELKEDNEPFDFELYNVTQFRDFAVSQATKHRQYSCPQEGCNLVYGSDRSLARHMKDHCHGTFANSGGVASRSRKNKATAPPSQSSTRPEKKARKMPFGGRMDWKTRPQEATGPTAVQPDFVDRRLSIVAPRTVKEEDSHSISP